MSETPTETRAPAETAALSRELSEFLVEFSIGVHRYVMYPPGHPSLEPVVESIVTRLAELLLHRRTLNIGVAQRQLVIEGVATDQNHPVLSDLAQRLHDHQLGALTLEMGVTAGEIAGLLDALSGETERGGTPLGFLDDEKLPQWEHARLHKVGYERLVLRSDGTVAPSAEGWADTLWLGLAQATLGEELSTGEVDGGTLARRLAAGGGQSAYEKVIAEYLRRIPRELRGKEGADSEKLRQRVAEFIQQMDDRTLTRLVGQGDPGQRRQFLLDANQSLAVDSVMRVLRAAASAEGQTISHAMTRMLSKLANHAEQGRGPQGSQSDTALRENVEALIQDWALDDPNPGAYTNVLDAMSSAVPAFQEDAEEEDRLGGAERLVEMALEVDAYGPIVAQAVTDLMEEGGTGRIMALLREAPDSETARTVRASIIAPRRFREILASGKLDDEGLAALIDEMGEAAVEPLLDVLATSQDRSVRRRVFDALLRMGAAAGERAVARLAASPWFVQRNMLALLHRLEKVPQAFDPRPYLTHDDARVRREAFPLALRLSNRDRVLVAALTDPDERMLRMGLAELREGVPDPVLPTLVNRVIRSEERAPELRAAAIRLLGTSRSPLALNTLLELTTSGKTLFGNPRLAPPSAEVVAALQVLARVWKEREEARNVLEQAAKSKEAALRSAAQGGPSEPTPTPEAR